jgi:signal transduction histidine kinase
VRFRLFKTGTGHDTRLWPVLLTLLLVVLVPTGCLLWFMSTAIDNAQLAARQTLEAAYRRDLVRSQSLVDTFWQQRAVDLESLSEDTTAAAVFAHCVRLGLADAVICYDKDGRLTYPAAQPTSPEGTETDKGAWTAAERLEYEKNDAAGAAAAYAAIAGQATDVNMIARALQAEARCLARAKQTDEAVMLITGMLSQPKFDEAVDSQGRLIVPSAELMALQLMGDPNHAAFPQTVERLRKRLEDYDHPRMAAAQRRFLMKQLRRLVPSGVELPTLAAEELAAEFVEAGPDASAESVLRPSPLPDVWQLASPSGRVVGLWHTRTVLAESARALSSAQFVPDIQIRLWPPERAPAPNAVFDSLTAGANLPGWQLTLVLNDPDRLQAAAGKQTAIYLWTGMVMIGVICGMAALIAHILGRQIRLARLKNDLVATVSHELKTPLASIRLLVDTLLERPQLPATKAREYLQLVAKENSRLSRLIDNFLTFSRMERNKRAFQFTETSVAEIVAAAVEVVENRFRRPNCRFDVQVDADLPPIMADTDALVTVLLNLLDNAYKYSADEKHIGLRAYVEDGHVCLVVSDHGIGLTKAASRKAFQRFYQVDRRLSRQAGGCGLGLSIVQFIVDAHGGTVSVDSRPGHGSTFTVRLPCRSDTPAESPSPTGRKPDSEE